MESSSCTIIPSSPTSYPSTLLSTRLPPCTSTVNNTKPRWSPSTPTPLTHWLPTNQPIKPHRHINPMAYHTQEQAPHKDTPMVYRCTLLLHRPPHRSKIPSLKMSRGNPREPQTKFTWTPLGKSRFDAWVKKSKHLKNQHSYRAACSYKKNQI